MFNPLLAGTALLVALVGIFAAWMLYGRRPAAARTQIMDPIETRAPALFKSLANAWGVDQAYRLIFVRGYTVLSDFLAGPVDKGLIDGIVNEMGVLAGAFSQLLRQLQTGFVRSYALMIFVGVVAILTYLVAWQIR